MSLQNPKSREKAIKKTINIRKEYFEKLEEIEQSKLFQGKSKMEIVEYCIESIWNKLPEIKENKQLEINKELGQAIQRIELMMAVKVE